MRNALGGNVKVMTCGSAPIKKEVLDFLQIAFSARILEGYGMTECTALAFAVDKEDPSGGHVGGVVRGLEVKLIDIPDMNYFSTDKTYQQFTAPRGEICLRGP